MNLERWDFFFKEVETKIYVCELKVADVKVNSTNIILDNVILFKKN